jgi:hypothetical protein
MNGKNILKSLMALRRSLVASCCFSRFMGGEAFFDLYMELRLCAETDPTNHDGALSLLLAINILTNLQQVLDIVNKAL